MADFFDQLMDLDPTWNNDVDMADNPSVTGLSGDFEPQLNQRQPTDTQVPSSPPRQTNLAQQDSTLCPDPVVELPGHCEQSRNDEQVNQLQDDSLLEDQRQENQPQTDQFPDDAEHSSDPLGDELDAIAEERATSDEDHASSSTVGAYPHDDVASLEAKILPDINTQKTPPPTSPSKNSPQPTSSTPKYDPRILLTPNKCRHRSPTPEATTEGTVNGLTLIHRLHNVSERDEVEPRKRKFVLTGEEDDAQKKAKLNGISGGGILGDALKKEAKQAAEKSGPPTLSANNTVDLTADDEDDVIFVEEIEKEVCLGMIEGAKVHAAFVPMPRTKTFQGSTTQWPQIQVELVRTPDDAATAIIGCKDPMSRRFGQIHYPTARPLAPLMDSVKVSNLRTKAWLKPRKKRPGEIPGTACSESCRRKMTDNGIALDIYIILYAPRKKAAGIGRLLGQANVWLREPPVAMIQKGIPFWNPQNPAAPPKRLDETDDSIGRGTVALAPKSTTYTRTVEETAGDMKELFDKLAKWDALPETETPDDVLTPLLTHQRQALTFLTSREQTHGWMDEADESEAFSLWKVRHSTSGETYYNTITGHESRQKPAPTLGGILADMMGLGKTLSMLSLLVSTKEHAKEFMDEDAVPRSPKRILKCNLKATLLVVPLSTIQNWEEQISTHIRRNKLKLLVYHGNSRTQDFEKLKKYDVVITCYPTLAAEWRRSSTTLKPMFDVNWFRIVLDEAHTIRNQTSGFFRSCCDLMGTRRWAITGTPVQNRLEDLGALFQFLRISPFDRTNVFNQYFISGFKVADPEILPKLRLLVDGITLRRLKRDTIDLPARVEKVIRLDMSEKERKMYDFFNADSNKIVKTLTANGKMGSRSYAQILKQISRMRRLCAHGEELLTEDDLKIAQGVHKENAIEIADDDDDSEDVPPLTDKQAMDMFYLLRESDFDRCEKCNKKIYDLKDVEDHEGEDTDDVAGYMTSCYHMYCPGCIDDFRTEMTENMVEDNYMNCPRCNQFVRAALYEIKESEITKDQRNKAAVRRDQRMAKHLARYGGPHTKVIHLLKSLDEHREWSNANPKDRPIKSVIFSEWTSHLDLIQIALETAGYKYARLDGSMTRKNRSESIDEFRDDPTITVMLATVGAAGLGLNLTVANHAYVMEPQFNPAQEAQAVDRVHRLGQTREVTITWYIMNKTFEETMLELQRKKKALADLSMDRKGHLSRADEKKKKLEDLRSLFK